MSYLFWGLEIFGNLVDDLPDDRGIVSAAEFSMAVVMLVSLVSMSCHSRSIVASMMFCRYCSQLVWSVSHLRGRVELLLL